MSAGAEGGAVFREVAAILALAAAGGVVATWLRQPLLFAFVIAGVAAGPGGLGWIQATEHVGLLGEFGVALLLFVVGLRLDLDEIRELGTPAIASGVAQVVGTTAAGALLALALGAGPGAALIVGLALAFSSTIVVVKLLSDEREIESLHGRLAIGVLIVQDLVVVLVMSLLTAGAGGRSPGAALGAGLVLCALTFVLARHVMPRLVRHLAASLELLVLAAIAWAFGLASAAEVLGLSKEVGAFLAGVTLASTPIRDALAARLVSVRDFLLLFFAVDLGAQLPLAALGGAALPAAAMLAFVLVAKPLIVAVILLALGYRRRTAFLAGLALAQISEFSMILAALGGEQGWVDQRALGLVTLVALVSFATTPYMLRYAEALYGLVGPVLARLERRDVDRDDQAPGAAEAPPEVVQFGLGRYGGQLAAALRRRGRSVLAVDFDPVAVRRWRARGLAVRFGDAGDAELIGALPLAGARWVVSTMPQRDANLALLHLLRAHGFAGQVALAAHGDGDAEALAAAGAGMVLLPFADAAEEAASIVAGEVGMPRREAWGAEGP